MEANPQMEGSFTILVADDAGASRQVLVRLLQQFTRSRRIIEVGDGAQAVSAFRGRAPEMAFLDIDMPEKDGITALREIRAISPEAFIVIVTGVSSTQNVTEALALGASAFVVKPFSARRIIEILKKCSKKYPQLHVIDGAG